MGRRLSRHLLDTSVLIGSAAGRSAPLPATAAISVISLGELHAGVNLAAEGPVRTARRERLAAIRAAFAALPVDDDVARAYGDVLALARRNRRISRATDLIIIATAAVHGRTLHTHDRSQASLSVAMGVPTIDAS